MPYNVITIPQIKCINVLLNKHAHLKDHKAEVIKKYTGGRADSTKDMTREEAGALIGYLKSLDPNEKKSDVMRKKVISMAHEMGWRDEYGKIKMDQVNGWCRKYSYLKKRLDEYSYEELPMLVTQFEAVYKDFLSKM